jgi:two-component system, OmpR family, alkaline phosphatase synthesis response regulator PhoP
MPLENSGDNHSKKILIVEDYVFYSQMIKAELENRGYSVKAVQDGLQAINSIQLEMPDLVLLDLIMPIKDGFETLEEIKSDPRAIDLKVLVFSNLSQGDDIEKVKTLGAVGYLVKKDFSLKELVDTIEKYLV